MSIYIEQNDEGPLCPRSGANQAPEHATAVAMLNAMYDAAERNEDNEMRPEVEAVYRAAQKAAPDYMRLYRATSSPSILGQGASVAKAGGWVESWWFECLTCHCILPAVGKTRG